MSSVRLRRLTADFTRLSDYIRRHPRLRLIQTDGDPAERYQIEYRIRSLRQVDGDLTTIKSHIVEIALPRNYPRTPPQCRMLSPVFHPNIAPHAICVGDHWSAGESLQSIVTRIGEMLAYQSYNVKSPLNGEAARWVQENEVDLPLDPVSMIVEDDLSTTRVSAATTPAPSREQSTSAAGPRQADAATSSPGAGRPAQATAPPQHTAAASPAQSEKIVVSCPQCERRYKVPPDMIGRNASCSQCGAEFPLQP